MTADLVDTTALDAVMAFLLGEGSLDGYWFGDSPPAGRGPYWWRKQLREAAARLRAVAGEPVCGWMPIESAPKESHVILFCDARGNRWTQTADCRVPVCGYPPIAWQEIPNPPIQAALESFANKETP